MGSMASHSPTQGMPTGAGVRGQECGGGGGGGTGRPPPPRKLSRVDDVGGRRRAPGQIWLVAGRGLWDGQVMAMLGGVSASA